MLGRVAHRGNDYRRIGPAVKTSEGRGLPNWHNRGRPRRRTVSGRGDLAPKTSGNSLERFVQPAARTMKCIRALVLTTVLAGSASCAHQDYFPGTNIVRTEENRKIIETVEQYRRRLVERNVEGLMILASPKYFEDSGTPRSDDDYGFEGLKQVLSTKLKRVKSLRYEIEYRAIRVSGGNAEVEVFVDGSFELAADSGDRYRRVNDYHRFMLAQEEDRWKFTAGM
jgi:hypothetical protein